MADGSGEEGEWVVPPRYETFRCDGIVDTIGNELLQAILAVVQDGICILNKDLDVIYANPAMGYWFPVNREMVGTKCYCSYHGFSVPCDECPTITAFETRKLQTTVKSYDKPDGGIGWHQVYSVPVLDGSGNSVLVIEYIREITPQKKAENKAIFTESQNKALMDFLEAREREREAFEKTVVKNVEFCIKPVLTYLEGAIGRDNMDIVKRQLDAALKGLSKNADFPSSLLSPRELEIAQLIKDNLASKEIAQKLAITKKAVDFHRTNIRKKLGLKPDDSLRIFLNIKM